MKIEKSNSLKLLISGIVLVAVAVSATIAWFGANTLADVGGISALVSSPSQSSGMDIIEYKYNGSWYEYDGSESLTIFPGETINFRVKFSTSPTNHIVMKLTDIVASGGTMSFTDSRLRAGTIPQLCSVLNYKVNSGSLTPFTNSIVYNEADDYNPELVMMTYHQVLAGSLIGGQQYVYYYDINMSGAADNTYQNSSFSFNLELDITKNTFSEV